MKICNEDKEIYLLFSDLRFDGLVLQNNENMAPKLLPYGT